MFEIPSSSASSSIKISIDDQMKLEKIKRKRKKRIYKMLPGNFFVHSGCSKSLSSIRTFILLGIVFFRKKRRHIHTCIINTFCFSLEEKITNNFKIVYI